MGKGIHIVPHGDNWAITREGNERPTRVTNTQREAIDIGRDIAQRDHAELYIHRGDGTIRERNSYGNDPYPPRG